MTDSLILQSLRTRSLWIVIGLVLAAELVVRSSLPAGKVPRGAYHSSEFRQQVERYPDALPVDMLIIGSSVASVNYPPVPLDNRLHELGHAGFVSYNAGIRGCNYECIAIGVRRFFVSKFKPAIVLVVLNAIDINEDNGHVEARSRQFSADMERDFIGRTGRQILSSISYVYGFKEEIREWLTSGVWTFTPAILRERGYVDMGSVEIGRFKEVPRISSTSSMSQSLMELVNELASSDTTVIILPVEGDSLSRSVFDDTNRQQFRSLMDSMIEHPNVHELNIDLWDIPDEDYIDTMHLDSQSAAANARLLADKLIESGLLDDYKP